MRRLIASLSAVASLAAIGCAHPGREVVISRSVSTHVSPSRAGIAVVATGGVTGWEHVTVLDSATARYVTVTRHICAAGCTPIDSSMGTVTRADVDRIYAIADSERALFERHKPGACDCDERAVVTTAVFGNRRRMVVRSSPEASPEVLGRVHVALAEAIRAARSPAGSGDVSTQPND